MDETIGLDEGKTEYIEPVTNDTPLPPTRDEDGIPYCRKHHCRMKQTSGGKKGSKVAYYACPVPQCKERAMQVKTKNEGIVPKQPMICPACRNRGKKVFMARDDDVSTNAETVLRCPSCRRNGGLFPVPQIVAAQLARREKRRSPDEEIGAR